MNQESSASSPVSRREFLRAAGALTGATAVGAVLPPAPGFSATAGGARARRTLGRIKLDVTIMTLGAAPFGIADDNFEETVLPLARKHNVGVVAMKAFGGPDNKTGSWGTRNAKPMVGVDRVEWAIRYALSLPGVATANLGVHTIEQFRQNLEIVRRFQPLATEEQERLARAGRELAKEWGPHFGPAA